MLTNNQYSSTNFTGAFRFKPNEIKAKLEVPELFTQGRQVFADIIEKGDQVIIVRDNYDKRIGKYIQENNITGVEYMPTINTKGGFDSERQLYHVVVRNVSGFDFRCGSCVICTCRNTYDRAYC